MTTPSLVMPGTRVIATSIRRGNGTPTPAPGTVVESWWTGRSVNWVKVALDRGPTLDFRTANLTPEPPTVPDRAPEGMPEPPTCPECGLYPDTQRATCITCLLGPA